MTRFSRLACLLALPAWLTACGSETPEVPSAASGGLDPAARSECTVQVAADIIDEIFPHPGLNTQASAKCGNILRQADRDLDDAVSQTFDFVGQTLDFYYDGHLDSPTQGTLEEAIVDLFAALFGAIGVAGPPLTPEGIESGEVAVGIFDEFGGTLTVPSAHAAIHFDPGDLAGDTWVTIAFIADSDPSTAGNCPFGFPVPNDCYPLFYDYSLVPATNLVDLSRIGQCVVEPPDLNAPPNSTVEARLRIASPDEANPDELIFWPLATAPGTVDCSDLAALGPLDARDALWAGLGPLQRLFRVGEAYANPGKLGASVSTFSPFAPTDPVVDGTIEVTVERGGEPVEDATVAVRDSAQVLVASGATGEDGTVTFTDLEFGTYFVQATEGPDASATEEVTVSPTAPTAEVTLVLEEQIIIN